MRESPHKVDKNVRRLSVGALGALVLIADDEDVNTSIIAGMLRRAGFENLVTATDGSEALAKAKALQPDLLILDIQMPEISGLDVCRQLRRHSSHDDLPILVQTALASQKDREQVFQAGATDLVTKPITRLELLARVGVHVERRILLRDLRKTLMRMESELKTARAMQLAILPAPEWQIERGAQCGLDIASTFVTSSELGGDLWGFINPSTDELGIYIVDFTGHGAPASFNTFRLHTLINEIHPVPSNPGALLSIINRRLKRFLPPGHFATMTCIF